jgi:sulfate permease, SulP family
MTHAATVLLVTLFFGRWAALIPVATLAGILLVVAYQMSEWRVFRAELTSPRSDVLVLVTTFLLTVLVDLTVAIEVGMVLAAFLFMRRMASMTNVSQMTPEMLDEEGSDELGTFPSLPSGVEIYEINGPFFFGAAETFKDTLARVARKPRVLILRMRRVPVIDATGLHALTDVVRRSRGDGTLVLLSEVQPQPLQALRRSVLIEEIGEEHLCPTLDAALARAREQLELRSVLGGTGSRDAVA